MLKKVFTTVLALGAISVAGQSIISNKSYEVEIKAKMKINTKVVETTEACVLTYDPQWAHEEDTRSTRVLIDNYYETREVLKGLEEKGYRFQGYQNKESCSVTGNTFPKVLTKNGEQYFVQYVKTATLLEAAKEQKAFKKVKRVYIRGFKKLKEGLDKKVDEAKEDLLKKVK